MGEEAQPTLRNLACGQEAVKETEDEEPGSQHTHLKGPRGQEAMKDGPEGGLQL